MMTTISLLESLQLPSLFMHDLWSDLQLNFSLSTYGSPKTSAINMFVLIHAPQGGCKGEP